MKDGFVAVRVTYPQFEEGLSEPADPILLSSEEVADTYDQASKQIQAWDGGVSDRLDQEVERMQSARIYRATDALLRTRQRRRIAGVLLASAATGLLTLGAIRSAIEAVEYGYLPRTEAELMFPSVDRCYEDPTFGYILRTDGWRSPEEGESYTTNQCLAATGQTMQEALEVEQNNSLIEGHAESYRTAIESIENLSESSPESEVNQVQNDLSEHADIIDQRREHSSRNTFYALHLLLGVLTSSTVLSAVRTKIRLLGRARQLLTSLHDYKPQEAITGLSSAWWAKSSINKEDDGTSAETKRATFEVENLHTGITDTIEILPNSNEDSTYNDARTIELARSALTHVVNP